MSFASRTDLNIVQLPSPIPVMGPAGSIVTDPDFGNQIIRVTDENTQHLYAGPASFSAGMGGSADVNCWNTDSTVLAIQNSGGQLLLFSFDPVTFASKRLYPVYNFKGSGVFSKINPNVFYLLNGSQYLKYDLTDRTATAPPTPTLVCDFINQLPSASTWRTIGGVENQDTVFAAAFSCSGSQGTAQYACIFTEGIGFRTYNTQTGVVNGYGIPGTVSYPDRYMIHNVKLNKTGQWLIVSSVDKVNCIGKGPYHWNTNTLEVESTLVVWGGHFTAGYDEFYNMDSSSVLSIPYPAHVRRSLYDLRNPKRLADPCPTAVGGGYDDHLSMNGPDGQLVVCSSCKVVPVGTVAPAFISAWQNEIYGFDLSGSGKAYRFCHTFASGASGNFYADNAIASGDQQNKFVAFTSDWQLTIGKRADVFVVTLR